METALKPLYIPAHEVRPLASALRGMACCDCGKRQSVWEKTSTVGDEKGVPICSLCFLYRSPWANGKQADLALFIVVVEETASVLFAKTTDNKMEDCKDADRIMSSIVLTTRLFHTRSKMWSKLQ